MKLLPVCRMSENCLGHCVLLMGQKRLPIPPAMMTQYVSWSGVFTDGVIVRFVLEVFLIVVEFTEIPGIIYTFALKIIVI